MCVADAAAGGVIGSFRAYLATSAGGPETRFALGGGDWVRPDGVVLSRGDEILSTDLQTRLETFLDLLSDGNSALGEPTWVGSMTNSCNDWTSGAGTGVLIGKPQSALVGTFRVNSTAQCALSYPVVCLQ